jgi:hypothetical protein
VLDLGVWWHEHTGLPLPLGGNAIRKDLGDETMQQVTNVLKRSIQYSLDHRATRRLTTRFNLAGILDRNLADKFVGMYVNQWTLDYGSARARESDLAPASRGRRRRRSCPACRSDRLRQCDVAARVFRSSCDAPASRFAI